MDKESTAAVVARLIDAVVSGVDPAGAGATSELDGTDAQKSAVGAGLNRLRGELARLRRREHELAALFSSARELAEVRDLDTLLGRLVTRAHEMMGTDVTYLSQFDPDTRELQVRKTAGAVTPQFQHLRVPPGMGMASGIAQSRTAQWALRYSDYAGDPHEPAIDEAVQAEDIVSILGVPMLAEGTVLGVLFAATRTEHAFTADEIALLSALADHASVVVQTANMVDQLRQSEEESRHALERLSAHLRERDRSNVVHQELVQTVLLGGGFQKLAATVSGTLGRSVTIIDAHARAIASSATPNTSGASVRLSVGVQEAIDTSRATGHCCFVTPADGPIEVVAAITAGEHYYGAFLLSQGTLELGPVDERTLERAAQVSALLTLQQDAADDADRRTKGELVADALAAAPERRRDLERRIRNHGLSLPDLNTVITTFVAAEHRSAAARYVDTALRGHGLVAEYAGTVVAVLHCTDAQATATDLRARLAEHLHQPVLTVTPPSTTTPEDLPEAFEVALRTARLLDALGVDNAAVSTEAYEPYAILFAHDPHALHRYIDTTIGVVLAYDADHDTDLAATLRAFVRNEASPTKTARALNYHPNTILQRLERLKALLGPDWRSDEHLYRISTAVRLDELRAQSVRQHPSGTG
ncbi:MAG: helix-turn-helix domain-containing protein [Mycobacterium sp.]